MSARAVRPSVAAALAVARPPGESPRPDRPGVTDNTVPTDGWSVPVVPMAAQKAESPCHLSGPLALGSKLASRY